MEQEIIVKNYAYAAREQKVLYEVAKGKVTCSFLLILTLSMPVSVRDADSKLLNPSLPYVCPLINQKFAATLLSRYLHCLIFIS